jgi:hypothetical protein
MDGLAGASGICALSNMPGCILVTEQDERIERCGNNQDVLLARYGKRPLTSFEFHSWAQSYRQSHPPIRPP